MIHLFCYESCPGCFNAFLPLITNQKKFVFGLFMRGRISKCQGLNSSCQQWDDIKVSVPGRVTQPGEKEMSSMARTSEASLLTESSPRITTCIDREETFQVSFTAFSLNIQFVQTNLECWLVPPPMHQHNSKKHQTKGRTILIVFIKIATEEVCKNRPL